MPGSLGARRRARGRGAAALRGSPGCPRPSRVFPVRAGTLGSCGRAPPRHQPPSPRADPRGVCDSGQTCRRRETPGPEARTTAQSAPELVPEPAFSRALGRGAAQPGGGGASSRGRGQSRGPSGTGGGRGRSGPGSPSSPGGSRGAHSPRGGAASASRSGEPPGASSAALSTDAASSSAASAGPAPRAPLMPPAAASDTSPLQPPPPRSRALRFSAAHGRAPVIASLPAAVTAAA